MLHSRGGSVIQIPPITLIQILTKKRNILGALIPPRIVLRARRSPGASKIKEAALLPPVLRHKKFRFSRALSPVLRDVRFLPVLG